MLDAELIAACALLFASVAGAMMSAAAWVRVSGGIPDENRRHLV